MSQSLLFLGASSTADNQLFEVTSPTAAATELSLAGYPLDGAAITGLTAFDGGLYFSGGTQGSTQLWALAGTSDTASQVTASASVPDLEARNLIAFDGKLYFSGQDASGNVDLYVSDGTAAGTTSLAVAGTSASGLTPGDIIVYGGRLYFSGLDATGVSRLWVSDGTASGTSVLPVFGIDSTNLNLGGAGLNPTNITVANGKLLFAGTDGAGHTGLWVSDGTSSGTSELAVTGSAPTGISPTTSNMVAFNGRTYFAGTDASGDIGLWSTDGTAKGTTELAIADSGPNGVTPVSLTVFDGSLYFGGIDGDGQTGLWKSDGTVAGTSELSVAGAAPGGLSPIAVDASDHPNVAMTVFDGSFYFSGLNAAGAYSLWRSDGTASGTVQVSVPDSSEETLGLLPSDLAVVDLTGTAATSTGGSAPATPMIPSSSLGTVSAATFAPVTLGSGPAAVTLNVAEEAYQGDARYTVSVDGVQLGGTLTATASYAAGQSQTVVLRGDWLEGTHVVAVDFLNDGWGGTAETDRNLYVSLVPSTDAVDGGSSLALLNGGTQTLTVQAEPASSADGGSSSSAGASVDTTPTSTLSGVDSTGTASSPASYIVAQTSSSTTYLTPGSGVSLTTAASLANVVYSQGADTIAAQGTSDLVFASGPAATVTGGSGTLIFVSGSGNYTAGGGSGTDILYGGSGAAMLTGASGLGNILVAGTGNATLAGGSGSAALMFGGFGMTSFVGSTGGSDTMVGGTGANIFSLTNGDIAFGGPDESDTFDTGKGSSLVVEGGGDTQVSLGGGSVTAFAGSGPDIYTVTQGLGGEAIIVGFKAADRISLTGGFTDLDAANALKSATTGSFGTALSLADGTRIVLSGATLQASQLVAS